MSEKPLEVSQAELAVLKALWEAGSSTVRQLVEQFEQVAPEQIGHRWAYTTVQTLLQRLEAKGAVCCDRQGFAHLFSPSVSRDDLLEHRLEDLAQQLCEGTAVPLVLNLVERQKFTSQDIAQFRRLLDGLSPQEAGPE